MTSPDPSPAASSRPDDASPRRALVAAAITTAVVTAVSAAAPDRFAATAVGVSFLAATWWLVLRHDELTVRRYGLSLGGLLEPTPIVWPRLLRDALGALAFAAVLAAIFFPPFWIGYRVWWHARSAFAFRLPAAPLDEIAGQIVVIALPEEAFFRGYLQTELDRAWPPRWRVLGADVGPGLFVSAAIFAVGHLLTVWNPARLAVFFPALVFGWLRQRTRGIGAGVAFHAACNLFSATLGRGYGISP